MESPRAVMSSGVGVCRLVPLRSCTCGTNQRSTSSVPQSAKKKLFRSNGKKQLQASDNQLLLGENYEPSSTFTPLPLSVRGGGGGGSWWRCVQKLPPIYILHSRLNINVTLFCICFIFYFCNLFWTLFCGLVHPESASYLVRTGWRYVFLCYTVNVKPSGRSGGGNLYFRNYLKNVTNYRTPKVVLLRHNVE